MILDLFHSQRHFFGADDCKERIRLLIHILRELRESHGITAEKLREAGQDVRRQIVPTERLRVLDEIYYVRQAEERYLSGEIGRCCPHL